MKRIRFLLSLPLCCALTVFPARGEEPAATPDLSEAGLVLSRAVRDRAFPGCTVMIGTDEQILLSGAFGHLDYEHKEPVTLDTIYDLASLTKVIGTTSVYLRLAADEKIKISDPVSKYLPELIETAPTDDEREQRKQITLEHLLTHTSGLTAWKPFYKTVNSYSNLLAAILETPSESKPGEKFRYSDPGMILLGEIAARAAGKPLPELERELVFGPLRMRNTFRNPPERYKSRIAPTELWPGTNTFVHGVVHDENARAGEGITGHAGLFSTVEDLGQLARELLLARDGKGTLFDKDTLEEFTRRRRSDLNRGLGWGMASGRDSGGSLISTNSFGHTGFTGTSIWIDPDRKLFIVLLTNRVHPTRDNNKIGRVRSELADATVRAFDRSLTQERTPATKASPGSQ